MTTLDAISHIALMVRDPSRTAALFKELFAAESICRMDGEGHDEVFVRLGGTWFVLVKADVERPVTGDHVAFNVSADAMRSVAGKLASMGHEFQMARNDTALYFTDFDNHVFELDSTDLEAALASGI